MGVKANPIATSSRRPAEQVHRSVQRRLKNCPYTLIFGKVAAHFEDGRLTLRGCVPSFYLKQVLQEMLRDVEHVKQLYNEVNVATSNVVDRTHIEQFEEPYRSPMRDHQVVLQSPLAKKVALHAILLDDPA